MSNSILHIDPMSEATTNELCKYFVQKKYQKEASDLNAQLSERVILVDSPEGLDDSGLKKENLYCLNFLKNNKL